MPGASSLLVLSGVSDTWIPSFTGLFRGRARTSQAIVSLHSLLLSCTHEQCTHRDGDLRASRLHLVADKSLHCLATALNARQPRLGGDRRAVPQLQVRQLILPLFFLWISVTD